MKLPKVESPIYSLTIPSTGEKIEFRPYLVKEEKLLFLAMESKDSREMMKAMVSIVEACTFGKIDVNKLYSYDLEYIFLQLRLKSVGEIVSLNLECEKDGYRTPIDFDLNEAKIVGNVNLKEVEVDVTSNIKIVLRPVRVSSLLKPTVDNKTDDTTIDQFLSAICSIISEIHESDSGKVYKFDEADAADQKAFVESLNHHSLQAIQKFISEDLPHLEATVEFACLKCGSTNKQTLKGLLAFFT